jgi:DNA-binding NarL/FixJ family response regulator
LKTPNGVASFSAGKIDTPVQRQERRKIEMTGTMDIETTSTDAPTTAFAGALRLHEPCPLGAPHFPGANRATDDGEEAAVALKTRTAAISSELASLQMQAEQAVRAYVHATLEQVTALVDSVEASVSLTVKNGHLRGKAHAVNERLEDFIASARHIMSVLNDGENRPPRKTQKAAPIAKNRHDETSLSKRLQLLTARENTVLELLLIGLPNKQISYQLGVSVATAKAHIGAILRKLNVSNRARVIALLANIDSDDDSASESASLFP